jgi:DNA topoisomerase I
MKPLVIVESPAKAKTIARFLGSEYVVESSIGHIRDLPRNAGEVPAAYKGTPWARLGVNVDEDFKPLYVISSEKKAQVKRLRTLLADASELYLATDEDREGESIAWHLREVLSPRVAVRRMVFHEITPGAIAEAIANPRDIDERLVDAQEARRILDRLYGYEVSPVLWKKVQQGLSAGRVQSVATRLVVDRERERMRFRSASWYSVEGIYSKRAPTDTSPFTSELVSLAWQRVATGRDFDDLGQLKSGRAGQPPLVLDEPAATGLAAALEGVEMTVTSVEHKPFRRSPAAPFITSTLQQEAARKLRFSAQRTMQVAQRLYEQGHITYMRTDSTTLSETALNAARAMVSSRYGAEFLPRSPRRYDRKVKNAQEAHEAIRPAGDRFQTPEEFRRHLHGDDLRLFELVWRRTVASQMNDALGTSAQVRLQGSTGADAPVAPAGTTAEMAASGRVITFQGFLRVYVEGSDDEEAVEGESVLPPLEEGERVANERTSFEGHATKPPARYTEATLVRALEERGIGRPSTYANIIGTIQARDYVFKRGTALVPTFMAFAVVGLLERHFGKLVDYGFTASMEDDLDEIANGQEQSIPWLSRFYFGRPVKGDGDGPLGREGPLDDGRGLKESVSTHLDEIDAREVNSIPIGRDDDGEEVVVRVGRYGPYLQRGEERASVPEDLPPDELTVARALELLAAPAEDRVLGTDPETGRDVLVKAGRFGPYVQLGEATEDEPKPRTSSLFRAMDTATVTLEQAIQLLSLPRVVGVDSEGREVVASNGRYGPFVKRETDTRSLDTEEQLLTITLAEAETLLAAPKRGRSAANATPLRELGADPDSGGQITLRSGRFGPYVTDGTINASLRKGDDPETITPERAVELLAARREAGPAAPRGRKRAAGTAKKAARTTKKAPGAAKKAASPAAKKAGGSAKKKKA